MDVSTNCDNCGTKFNRLKRQYNEAIKYGWKQYCSAKCQSEAKKSSLVCICANPLCQKKFLRQKSEFEKSELHFCSHSCCATYSNAINHTMRLKKCFRLDCNKYVHLDKRSKYCSRRCANCVRRGKTKYSPELVTIKIKKFFKQNSRLPTKRDLSFLYRLTRRFFGTWNEAIEAAGFEPNLVRFSRHFVANDGHPCDSLSEKIIDDWLFARKIPHEVKVKYPWDNGMSADFKIGEYWIELFGLTGQLKSYDRLMKIKLEKIKEYRLNLISIYLGDLFPSNRLGKKLWVLQR